MSTTKREDVCKELQELDDWDFLSVIQQAIQGRNIRNKRDHKPPPIAKDFPESRFLPSQYVVALWNPKDLRLEETSEKAGCELQALAMHLFDQVDKYHESARNPESWLASRLLDSCKFHEGGSCDNCGIQLCAAGTLASCPICGAEVYLT